MQCLFRASHDAGLRGAHCRDRHVRLPFFPVSRYSLHRMGTEIERKFLVANDAWRSEVTEILLLRQGYLSTAPGCTVRVRVSAASAWLTIKGRPVGGIAPEFEYPIPAQDALSLLDTLAQKPLIEKKRHCIPKDGLLWEVDEFLGCNAGLILAEVELADADQTISLPSWIGEEVTGDPRYSNAFLVSRPFADWEVP